MRNLVFGFVERPRKEEAQKHQQVDAQRAQHRGHHELAPARDYFAFVRFFGFGKYGAERLRQRWLLSRRRWRGPGGL